MDDVFQDNQNIYKEIKENIDFSNLDCVILKITEILNKTDLVTEQKLHAIGLILDKNKETYIRHIKDEYFKLHKKIEESQNGNLVIINEIQAKQITSLCKNMNKLKGLVQENKYLMFDNMRLREELNAVYKEIKVLKNGVIISESNTDEKI